MGLETYYCYIFYGLTLIYLTGPLSQVVQLKCDIYIYIYKEMCEGEIEIYPIFLLLWEYSTFSSWTESWEKMEELIDPSFSDCHAPGEQLGEHQRQDRKDGFSWHQSR